MNGKTSEYVVGGLPGVTVGGLHVFGYPIADVTAVFALIWTICSLWFLFYDRFKRKKNGG